MIKIRVRFYSTKSVRMRYNNGFCNRLNQWDEMEVRITSTGFFLLLLFKPTINHISLNIFPVFCCRTPSTAVQRAATRRPPHRTAGTRVACATRPTAIRTVRRGAAWAWAWAESATVRAATRPSLCTRRREKIETTSCPPLGISIPVSESGFLIT